jgi:hypothetical protein
MKYGVGGIGNQCDHGEDDYISRSHLAEGFLLAREQADVRPARGGDQKANGEGPRDEERPHQEHPVGEVHESVQV